MKVKELQSLSIDELAKKEEGLRKELSALNFQQKMGRVEKPSQFRLIRKDIARILTVANQKKKAEKKK